MAKKHYSGARVEPTDDEYLAAKLSEPEPKPAAPRKRKVLRAIVFEPLAIVNVLQDEHCIQLSSTRPGKLNHEACSECGSESKSLEVKLNEDGSGWWKCHRCDFAGEVVANRMHAHWYSPDERASWERQLSDDKEWRTRVERRRLEEEILLTAARLVAAKAPGNN